MRPRLHLDIVMNMTYYMSMKEYKIEKANIAQVKEHLSSYVALAEQGTTVVVCRRNRPVAELVSTADAHWTNRTELGSAPGSVDVKCDLTEPALDASDWSMLQ